MDWLNELEGKTNQNQQEVNTVVIKEDQYENNQVQPQQNQNRQYQNRRNYNQNGQSEGNNRDGQNIGRKRYTSNSEQLRASLLVKKEWGGAVIGKGGETIKGLRRQLRANIVVHPPKERRQWQNIDIEGTPEKLEEIYQRLHQIFIETNDEQYKQEQEDARVTIFIFPEMVGQVIGKQGATIKQMKIDSGANIRVAPSVEQKDIQEIHFFGAGEAVANAFAMACENLSTFDFRKIKNKGYLPPTQTQNQQTPTKDTYNTPKQQTLPQPINQANQPVIINGQAGMPQIFIIQGDGTYREVAQIVYKDQLVQQQAQPIQAFSGALLQAIQSQVPSNIINPQQLMPQQQMPQQQTYLTQQGIPQQGLQQQQGNLQR